jgi:hypothetical protein
LGKTALIRGCEGIKRNGKTQTNQETKVEIMYIFMIVMYYPRS